MASKLVVIVGETASGKSALGLQLAKQFNGEIICADSRTIYKGMDIGTAKPTKAEQTETPHHLLDIVKPGESFTVADFKQKALEAIDDITARGKLPIVVGGTGLYIDSLIFDYQFGSLTDQKYRTELNKLSLNELQKQAESLGISEDAINFQNRRHLTRAIENGKVIKQDHLLRPSTLVIGQKLDRGVLEERIEQRIDQMVNAGLVDEVSTIADKYGWDSEAMTGIGYSAFRSYLEGSITLEEAKSLFKKGDIALAKKQRTWFKRNKYIQWLDDPYKAVALVTTFLNT